MTDNFIWIAAGRRSGEPCIGEHGVMVDPVVRTVWAHGVEEALAQWPQLSRGQILTACWYAGAGYPVILHGARGEYSPRNNKWAARWGKWARRWHGYLWSGKTDVVKDPPGKKGK